MSTSEPTLSPISLDDLDPFKAESYKIQSSDINPQNYEGRPNLETAEAYAVEHNLTVHYPGPNELTLDLDTPTQVKQFEDIYPFFCKLFRVKSMRKTRSKNGGTHVYINMETTLLKSDPDRYTQPLYSANKIAMQAALGSDPKRELLSMVRSLTNDKCPSLLFEIPVNTV